MLPTKLKHSLFDKISAVTMRRFFHPQSLRNADGLIKKVLTQSQRDFFINGTITCHWSCPELMAGLWVGGREIALVDGELPAWLKIAMGASLSQVNQCPYCEDMLLSLTHGAQEHNVAASLRDRDLDDIDDALTQRRLKWIQACATGNKVYLEDPPFDWAHWPEALGTLLVFGYTNRISDFALDGSPVPKRGRGMSLKLFGVELRESAAHSLAPGSSLDLLPEAGLPVDLQWASNHTRVADAVSRWNGAVERAITGVLSVGTEHFVRANVSLWQGEGPPLSRSWVEDEVASLRGAERDKARLMLLAAKASYQIDDGVIERVTRHGVDEAGLMAMGAWAGFLGAKQVVNLLTINRLTVPATHERHPTVAA
jgi:hypothetical protein